MANPRLNLPRGRLIAAAAIAGAIAGALGLYVMGDPSGNNSGQQGVASDQCPAASERMAAIDAAIVGEVAAMLPADPPRQVGDLAFDAPDGKPMTLGDVGKVTLLNLWATWCAPCREEMPALDRLQTEMGGEEFEVVAVNVDSGGDEKPRGFLDEIGVESLAYYRDRTLGIFNELKTRNLALGLPVTLLIDGRGCLLAHMNGPAEWASDDARTLIEAALSPQG